MVYNLNKEPCNCCNRPINIGQSIAECSSCDKIIHGRCFNDSNFLFVNNTFVCFNCSENPAHTLKYNPFTSLNTDSESTKFYDIEPSDVLESTKQMSNILNKCSLYNTSEVNKLFSNNGGQNDTNTFSSYFLNIDGNKTNFDKLMCELETFTQKFSVIGLAETNIDPALKSLYEIPEYKSYYQSVADGKSKGTGVAIYIHESLNSEINEEMSKLSPNLESIFVNITNMKKLYLQMVSHL